jgi:HEPN domain-containing protein
MALRAQDWLRQGKRDLEHARRSAEQGDYEWACFAAHQAAEKALKAVYQSAGEEAWGHSILGLLAALPLADALTEAMKDAARELDRHYIPARYPNSYPEGAPYEYYTQGEAERALAQAEQILRFCENHLTGPEGGSGGSPTGL